MDFSRSYRPIYMTGQQNNLSENVQTALDLIQDIVATEKDTEQFYNYLINQAPDEEDREIIRSIRNEERKHYKMLRKIYSDISGKKLPPAQEGDFTPPDSYLDGLVRGLFSTLSSIDIYQRILSSLQNTKYANMLCEIIIDQLQNASRYNYLYTKNSLL